jgi:hypothetical protein
MVDGRIVGRPVRFALALVVVLATAPAFGHEGEDLDGGGGPTKGDCLAEFDFGTAAHTTKRNKTTVTCTDCDPTCDANGTKDGKCEFQFDVCPNQCQPPATIRRFKVRGAAGRIDKNSTACATFSTSVKLRRKGKKPGTKRVRVIANTKGRPRLRDNDIIVFKCLPRTTGECPTTTTTTTTITSTTTSIPATTTTTIPCDLVPGPGSSMVSSYNFTTTAGMGDCGAAYNDLACTTSVKTLHCGGLNIGGGASTVAEGPTPDGATSRFCIESCSGTECTLKPASENGPTFDCSVPGCFFGPPLPIPNGGTTTCVVNTWREGGSGTVDVVAGTSSNLSVPLNSQTYLTGTASHPCPLCRQGDGSQGQPVCAGTPDSPCTGRCEGRSGGGLNLGGPNEGKPCVSTNSQGLSKDCPPGGVGPGALCDPNDLQNQQCLFGVNLGGLAVTLAPLSTGSTTVTDANGFFCPHQDPSDQEPGQVNAFPGCFGTTPFLDQTNLCRCITATGSPAGTLLPPGTSKDMTVAANFCIPRTGSLLVDLSAALPGPGEVSLAGTAQLLPVATTTTTTTSTTTTSTTTTTTSSTTTTT